MANRARFRKVRIACFDNGGKTTDRYTVVFLDVELNNNGSGLYECIGMSSNPTDPQGFCQHSTACIGRHLGKRITLTAMPFECQHIVMQEKRDRQAA